MDDRVTEHLDVVRKFEKDHLDTVHRIAEEMIGCFENRGKALIFGNGGSASDAMHFAGELVGSYSRRERIPLSAITPFNPAALTAIANDYGYEHVFERFTQAHALKGDLVIGISTSGDSPNVIYAMESARKIGTRNIGFTGKDGGLLKDYTDILLTVPSDNTQRVQECHVLAYHLICDKIDSYFS